jgi:serine/threonine protein kinase
MNDNYTFSEFETGNENTLIPINSNYIELLPFKSSVNLVYKIKINNKWLLLKRIVPEFREHPFYISCFEKEFDIGFNLDHPNIVKYLNKGKDSEGTYLLAEYIDGITLRDFILKNPDGLKDEKWVLKIVKQLLDALDYLHKRQLFHLDLKPENLMITHKGDDLKIIDFGLSSSDSYSNFASGTKNMQLQSSLKTLKIQMQVLIFMH